MVDKRVFHKSILDWYRLHKRSLPWRNEKAPNPYHIWLSEIMLQQTRVVTVLDYFNHFTTSWKTLEELAKADEQEVLTAWAGLGYYSRARNLIKCAKEITTHHGGKIPETIKELEALPGIGKYTAAAIAAIAYGKPTTPIDGNIERIMARIYAITTPLPKAKKELWQKAQALSPQKKSGEWAQALMDMGTMICTPKTPKCPLCPIEKYCQAQKQNLANQLPKRPPPKKKPTRYATAYVIENHKGELLLEKRKEKGLLGGMTGFPTNQWQETKQTSTPPWNLKWQKKGTITHSFTHFHLTIEIKTAQTKTLKTHPHQKWIPKPHLPHHPLPTLMKKIAHIALNK